MYRTTTEIETILLNKANIKVREDLRGALNPLKKVFINHNLPDERRIISTIIHDILLNHIKTPLSQECMLHQKSEELITKMDELEDMIADQVCEEVSNQGRYP